MKKLLLKGLLYVARTIVIDVIKKKLKSGDPITAEIASRVADAKLADVRRVLED